MASTNRWPAGFTIAAGVELLHHGVPVTAANRSGRDDGCKFQQSLTAHGMGLQRRKPTLVGVEQ